MAKGDKGKGQRPASQTKHGVVTDPRFARMHHDPRFRKFPNNTGKVEIDDRFKGMFEDADFQGVSVVDKRGRTVAPARRKGQDLKRYYRLKDEEEWQQDAPQQDDAQAAVPATPARQSKPAPEAPATSSDSEGPEADEDHRRWARARGLVDSGSSSDTEGSSDEGEDESRAQDSADEALDPQEWGVGALAANPEEQIPVCPPTRRLALVDLDWSQLRAVDILAAMRSFCPSGGRVERVTVYPSDYGLQQMAAERESGPRAVLRASDALDNAEAGHKRQRWQRVAGKARSGAAVDDMLLASEEEEEEEDEHDDDDDEEEGVGESDEDVDAQVAAAMGGLSGSEDGMDSESGSGEDEEGPPVIGGAPGDDEPDTRTPEEKRVAARIRMYERSKLRWYYAIAECDTKATALRLYEECDGLEFQRSACKFDLRFVPDEQCFDSREVRDSAADVPHDYEPPVFHTRALQHTEVKLTWDEDDVHRKRVLGRRPAADELKDDDFKAYLASESDSEEGDAPEQVQDKYRALLQGTKDERRADGKGWGGAAASEDEAAEKPEPGVAEDKGMEMEVTFAPGLDSLGKKILDKARQAKGSEGETVWEAYMRRKRDKRRLAKELGKARADSDTSDEDGEGDEPAAAPAADPFDDPFFNDDGAGEAVASDEEAPVTTAKNTKKGKKKGREESAAGEDVREAAQLELLLMDDAALTHMAKTAQPAAEEGPTKQSKASRAAKARAKKEAKRRAREQGSDEEHLAQGNDFAVNLDDSRFSVMLTSPEFALDPTDPRYKQATAVVEGVRKRRKRGDDKVPKAAQPEASAQNGELKMMISKLKKKSKKKAVV